VTHARRYMMALGLGLLATQAVLAAPALKSDVRVVDKVVTVGDMFDNAGKLASQPLFLAPAPGTSGMVEIADIRLAALKVGIETFDDRGETGVNVSRLAVPVDQPLLNRLLSDGLASRGVLLDGMTANAVFDSLPDDLEAAAVPDPVKLRDFSYMPDSGNFTARVDVAGQDIPLDLSGRIDLTIEAPELKETLAAGTILAANDIVMQSVPAKLVVNGNIASEDQLVGKQLQRQSHAGMLLKVSDVADPTLIQRNDPVTVYLHTGALTLTVKGMALNAASLGQPVAVLNAISKKVIHGVARSDGGVEIAAMPLSVAGL